MSTESTPTPAKKRDKIFGFDIEDITLGLASLAAAGVAVLGVMKVQEMGILKPPGAVGPPQSRVTIGPPPEVVVPPVVAPTTPGGMVERDPLGPNANSVVMDGEVDQEKFARSRAGAVERINAGY